MKQKLLLILLSFTFIFRCLSQSSLPLIDSKEYENLKVQGLLPLTIPLSNTQSFTPTFEDLQRLGVTHKMGGAPGNPNPTSGSGCSCYIPPDNTYTLAMSANDDGSSNQLTIPFQFCLYGTNYNSLYINNNGNVSFGGSYSTFSSNPFPDPNFVMVAPFWADVDTRGTGSVYYKITPSAMYINWQAVGYYSQQTDKVNTFQLIITDGNDPILPTGNNIAFCYGDMQWTTGSASSGVNGFGGTAENASPATVGVNKGDGTNYIQIGRYAYPGSAYDGGYGADDGVDWLDNQSFYFNSCSGTNIAPIVSGVNNCDTIKMCGVGDTLILTPLFLSPENGQTTTVTVNANGMQGVTVLSNTPGNNVTPQVMVVSSGSNAGNNIITFTATDNGTPAGVTTVNVNVYVDPSSAVTFFPVISGNPSICSGDSTLLSVSPTNYDSYHWNTGSSTTAIYADTAGQYWVTSTYNGCYRTNFINVVQRPTPNAAIASTGGICSGGSTVLTASGGDTYRWLNNNDTSTSLTVSPAISTTYTVQAQSIYGCQDTAQATINVFPTPVADFTANGVCKNSASSFSDVSTFGGTITSWNWNFGDNSPPDLTQNPSHFYSDTGAYNVQLVISTTTGCSDTVTKQVVVHPLPHAQFFSGSGCVGSIIPFVDQSTIASPDAIQFWSWDFGDNSPGINTQSATHEYSATGQYTSQLLVVSNFGCRDSVTGITSITPPLVVNFSASDTMGCNPLCTNFQNLYVPPAGHTATYIWDFGDSTLETTYSPHHCFINSSLTLPESFSVTLTVIPDTGCITSYTRNNYINVLPSPIADFEAEPPTSSVLFPTTSFSNFSQGGTSWDWDFGDSTTSADFAPNPHNYSDLDTAHYTVSLVVTNNFGCKDTAIHIVEVHSDWSFYVPNAFTPNSSNGLNDLFQGYGFGFKEYEMTIFDRWGQQLYRTNSYNQPWDGTLNNNGKQKLEAGVYVYLFTIIDKQNVYHNFRGTVTLAR